MLRSRWILAAVLAAVACRQASRAPAAADTTTISTAPGQDLRTTSYGGSIKPAKTVYIASVQGTAACPATGNCRVILGWTSPPSFTAATDTAHTTWAQATPTATVLVNNKTVKGTADTLSIARPVPGASKTGTVQLCHTRKGWYIGTDSLGNKIPGRACNAAVAWTVTAPVVPIDTATALKVTMLPVTPSSIDIVAGATVQLCPIAVWNTGEQTGVIPWPIACESVLTGSA